jgi:hypothetical protein
MIDNIISEYGNKEFARTKLETNERLRNLALEFCSTFKNVRVSSTDNNKTKTIQLVMENGLTAGHLAVNSDAYGGYYTYSSDAFVKKSKATSRANKQTRDSKTITGLIKAVVKNKEWPQYTQLYESFDRGIRYAFQATLDRDLPYVDVNRDTLSAMIINHVEGNGLGGLGIHDAIIREKYDELMLKRQKSQDGKRTFNRFVAGCKLIGISSPYGNSECTYYVGSVSAALDKGGDTIDKINLIHLQRYNYLTECDLVAGDMAIIKTYMQGKNPNADNNPFYIQFGDRYYPDIDVATGYENREMLWVLIPYEA